MLIVQKYGGTSVGSIERIEAVADRIKRTVRMGHRVAVVVSAMGHTTDELVGLAHAIDKVPSPREMDALLSTGEQVSAALVSMALQKRGLKAKSLTGWQAGIETEAVHGRARMASIDTDVISRALEAGEVPVITGFQGIAGEDVTTLGRGGSDTTAVAVAAALEADVCEIYTDVKGVYTTDPRMAKGALKLDEVTYDEMLELANLGAQVLHPRAVENAKQFGVRLVVKSSFEEEEGTYVVGTLVAVELRKVVTGIAFEREVARIALTQVPVTNHGLATVFRELASHGVNVDVIVQSIVHESFVDVSFTVKEEDQDRALKILTDLKGILEYESLIHEGNLAKVSIVGAGMVSNPGVAAQMFDVLAGANVPVKMVSTSEIKVSCIISKDLLEGAVTSLHQAFMETE